MWPRMANMRSYMPSSLRICPISIIGAASCIPRVTREVNGPHAVPQTYAVASTVGNLKPLAKICVP